MAVAVRALVKAGDAAEVGSGTVGRDGSLSESGHCRSVVREVFDRGVGNVVG